MWDVGAIRITLIVFFCGFRLFVSTWKFNKYEIRYLYNVLNKNTENPPTCVWLGAWFLAIGKLDNGLFFLGHTLTSPNRNP